MANLITFLPIIILIVLLFLNLLLFENTMNGPNQIALLITAFLGSLIAFKKGKDIQQISKGITTSIHYPIPLHKQQAYKINKNLPATEKISKQIVSLPMYPELNGNQIKYICSNIIKVLSEL